MSLILLIVLLLLLFGGLPRWGYHSYGYGPSGRIALARWGWKIKYILIVKECISDLRKVEKAC